MLRVVTVLGTRPEIIRLSRVIARLDEHFEHKVVHTGQNYDYELNEIFFEELGVRVPDYFLGIDARSVGRIYGNILIGVEEVLEKERPDAVLVLGDTNSAIGAIMAKRMRIPIYHMEAGNRAFDLNVPEEINRKIIDHISDFNLVYTERSRQHLLAEGLPHRRIYLTGSPMREVIEHHAKQIEASGILGRLGLEEGGYFVASIHREENVDDPTRLSLVFGALTVLGERYGKRVVVSTHPRTRKRLEASGSHATSEVLRFLKPFSFCDYVRLQRGSLCVISDSGTVSEESAIVGFPAVTLRDSMERPEALDAGTIMMAPVAGAEALVDCVSMQVDCTATGPGRRIPWEYEIRNTSERVAKLMLSTARLSNVWSGVRSPAEMLHDA